MRSIAALLGTLLLPIVANGQCSSAVDVPVAGVSFAPTCSHSHARVAANAAGALSMWGSSHAGFGMVTYWMSGTILDSAGAPRQLPEHLYQYGSATPELATDGHDYLLAWVDGTAAYIRMIDADGHADGEVVKVADGLPKPADLRVVWNGTAYTLVTTSNGSAIAVVISASGRVMETGDITAGASPIAISAAAPDRVAVLMRTATGIESVIINGAKRIGEPVSLPIAATTSALALATNGSGFLAVWRDQGQVSALLLDGSGAGTTMAVLGAGSEDTSVVWEGGSYLALWSDNDGGVRAARVNGDGSRGSHFRAANGALASAAFNGYGTIVLTRMGCASIASTFLARGSESGASRDVSLAAVSQSVPQIVETSRGDQIFWRENELFTRFVSREGTFSETRSITQAGTYVLRYVAARAGNSTIVVSDEYANGRLPAVLRAVRFDDDGNELESTVVTNARFIYGLAVASTETDLVVTWTQQPQNGSRFEVFAARLNADGAVTVAPTRLSAPDDDMYEVVAGADASRSIVAWRNGASTVVSVELGSQLEVTSRREFAFPGVPVLFPVAAAIHDARSLILFWSTGEDGVIRLHAIDPAGGPDASVSTGSGLPLSVKVVPRGDGWLVYFARLEDGTSNEILQRVLLSDETFGAPAPLLCAAGDLDYTLRGDTVGALAYAAPQKALENASRLYFRNSLPNRRRAAR